MIRFVLALFAVVAVAAADIVMTTKEVILCEVTSADSNTVRLRLPAGTGREVEVSDIFELRIADEKKADWLTTVLPKTKVVHDPEATRVGRPPAAAPEVMIAEAPPRDPVASGRVMLGGGASFSGTSISGTSYTTLTLSPDFTYFVYRGIGVGLELAVQSTSMGGGSAFTTSVFGPKLTGAFGPEEGTSFFLLEAGVAFTGATGSSGGERTVFGIGYLPVIGGHLGLPVRLRLLVDRVGEARQATWQFGVGFSGML